MAKQLIGTVLRVHRMFGRVHFTVAWQWGETEAITVPKEQFDAAIRKGDTVEYDRGRSDVQRRGLIRWNTRDPAAGPVPVQHVWPRMYHRVRDTTSGSAAQR